MRKPLWVDGAVSGLLNRETQTETVTFQRLNVVGEEILRCGNRKSWTVRLVLCHEVS